MMSEASLVTTLTSVIDTLLSDDGYHISYRPKLRGIADSALSGILLSRIWHWWNRKDRKAFFKFQQPCKHKLYKEGDSWTEELGFSRSEFNVALKRIGTKITKGMSKADAMRWRDENGLRPKEFIVLYWTDSSRVTWYWVNEMLFRAYALMAVNPALGNAEILHYLEMLESGITYEMQKSSITFFQEDSNKTTEKTAESEPTPAKQAIQSLQAAGIILSGADYQKLIAALENYPLAWIEEAAQVAKQRKVLTWRYVEGCLRRKQAEHTAKEAQQRKDAERQAAVDAKVAAEIAARQTLVMGGSL